MVFENRVLRKTRGSKSDDVKSGWRKLHIFIIFPLPITVHFVQL